MVVFLVETIKSELHDNELDKKQKLCT